MWCCTSFSACLINLKRWVIRWKYVTMIILHWPHTRVILPQRICSSLKQLIVMSYTQITFSFSMYEANILYKVLLLLNNMLLRKKYREKTWRDNLARCQCPSVVPCFLVNPIIFYKQSKGNNNDINACH